MTDYKHTLNLPQTDFPMKANLPTQEPLRLAFWEAMPLYQKIRAQCQGKKKFILHDGPPYANGHLHLGHALNKILKDMVVKSKTMSGYDAPFLPGWDCHGLPIELNVEKTLGKVGADIDAEGFRAACRKYAQSQIEIQKNEFKRLGVFGDYADAYSTMDFQYEARVIRNLGQLIQKGLVYQGLKPVHWCVACGSALAEAELEYVDKQSSAIDVAFKAQESEAFAKVFQVTLKSKPLIVPIWTTTPWTLPANEAVALSESLMYGLYETETVYLVLLEDLSEASLTRYGVKAKKLTAVKGEALAHLKCHHPFLEKIVPLIVGKHVTSDAGTGCVHTAPAHGVEDYDIAQVFHLPCETPVSLKGRYKEGTPFFADLSVLKADGAVIEKLKETKTLLAQEMITHSYPCCWRHKIPMIFLVTPQWFITMDNTGLRDTLLKSLETIRFIPDWGKQRMANMIASRPDWCISRQRNWGTPIPVFIHKKTGKLHPKTAAFIEKIAELVEQKGLEAWFEVPAADFLGNETEDYDKVTDTLDVWFDAGSSYAAVLLTHPSLAFPADLYLEGSDQYRGWFNASLTNAVAIQGVPPYRSVITHGYTVDATGKKLSKSQGNYVALEEVVATHGADLLRLWVASTDYRHEVTISDEILKRLADAYRRIRNTARFLLANLFDFQYQTHAVPVEQLLSLDQYMVMRTQALQQQIIKDYEQYDFHLAYQKIFQFCSIELGSFYLDVIKDRQYTTGKDSIARRSCQTAMYYILQALVRWIAPILSFTAEEIWQTMAEPTPSVFLTGWYDAWPTVHLTMAHDWECLQQVREEVNKALELAREAKVIGSGLAAEVDLYVDAKNTAILATLGEELKFFLITASACVFPIEKAPKTAYLGEGGKLAIEIKASTAPKCVRCWHRSSEVGSVQAHPELCQRCADTVAGVEEQRQFV